MTVILPVIAQRATTLDLAPDHSAAHRRHMALRDLRDAAALWRLCATLAWLDIKLRYRGSMLGPLWLTLSTAVMVGSMGILYAALFQMDLHLYLPYLALSLVLWNFLAGLVNEGSEAFTGSEAMIRSVRLPFTLYSARIVLRNAIVFAHNFVVVIAVDVLLRNVPGFVGLMALPGMALWMVDALAVGLLLATLCARFRDVPPIVGSVLQIAFFISAIIWRPEQLGVHEWMLLFNPFYTVLELVRGPLLGAIPSVSVYASALAFSAVLCGVSWLLFVRVRGRISFWL